MKMRFLLVFAVLIGMLAGSVMLEQTMAGTTNIDDLIVRNLTITGDQVILDDMVVSGDGLFNSGIQVAGTATLFQPVFETRAITLTAGQSITPEHGAYHLSSTGAVSMTLAACVNDGQLVSLYGDDANTITVNDTNIRSADGNAITFGQYDTVVLQCFDAEWNLVSKSANQ